MSWARCWEQAKGMVSVESRFGASLVRQGDTARGSGAPTVLIIVQNLPLPMDRRVWLECRALTDAGYRVVAICPKAPGDPRHQVIDGVDIYKYAPYPPTTRKIGFVAEYVWSFVLTAWLTAKVWRRHRFDALQACNPPDIFWPLGLLYRGRAGVRFVFDQHDLCPELYESRFPEGPRLPGLGIRMLEARTYAAADHVIATNESYRATAIGRGHKPADSVTVVRTGPDPQRLRRCPPDPDLRAGRRFLACYVGVMGPQDGVDIVLRAAARIVHDLARDDIAFTLVGTGDCYDDLVALRAEMGLEGHVQFTGRAPDEVLFQVLSTADVGLSPDPKNPLNDVSTMNKT
ncbi:MAG: glycosyltransferase family 4 protein, partial [Actinomycetota bacterium]|nr:glycosyltransferase family 4 protein [Actinomycetota bacterium]